MRAGKVDNLARRTRRKARLWLKGFTARQQGLEPVHILHIYKTGGTALKHALEDVSRTTSHAIFSQKHSIGLDCIPRGHKVVFVVRDPVTRFVSGFYDRKREGRPRYHTPWSKAERATFERFETPGAIGEALATGGEPSEAARAALASLDRMTVPWSAWLGSTDDFLIRRPDILLVGRQETLAADFDKLRQLLGLPDDARLPLNDVDAHRARNVDRGMSETARAALTSAFSEDYAWLALLERTGLLPPLSLTSQPEECSGPQQHVAEC